MHETHLAEVVQIGDEHRDVGPQQDARLVVLTVVQHQAVVAWFGGCGWGRCC